MLPLMKCYKKNFEFYNKTKASVVASYQNVKHCNAYCKTYCWSLALFYNSLNISTYNAYVLYQMRPLVADKDGSSRAYLKFLCAFSEEIIKPNMYLRAQHPNRLSLPTKNAIKAFSIQIINQKIQRFKG